MPLNVSREEVLTSYEQEVKKLRRLGKEWRLKETDIDEIIHESFHFLKDHCDKESDKSLNRRSRSESLCSLKFTLKLVVLVVLMFLGTCLFISYHKPTYNVVVRNVQELIYPTMKCLRRITLPIVKAFPSITGNTMKNINIIMYYFIITFRYTDIMCI